MCWPLLSVQLPFVWPSVGAQRYQQRGNDVKEVRRLTLLFSLQSGTRNGYLDEYPTDWIIHA